VSKTTLGAASGVASDASSSTMGQPTSSTMFSPP
jgi:hypothetical protein